MAAEGLTRLRRRRAYLDTQLLPRVATDLFESEVLDPLENVDFRMRPVQADTVLRLASLYMDVDEIAKVIDMPIQQVKDVYGPIIEQGRQEAVIALRRARWRVAMRGNVAMLLHLSQELLNEKPAAAGDNITNNFIIGSQDDPRTKLLNAVREASERMVGREVQPVTPLPQIAAGDTEF